MGSIDISGIMNDILVLVLFPALIGSIGSIAGVNLGPAGPILNAFMQLLPVIIVLNIFGDMFKGIGGSAGRILDSFMNVIVLLVALPALMGAIGNVAGLGSLGGIFNAFMQLLPIIVLFQLFGEMFKSV